MFCNKKPPNPSIKHVKLTTYKRMEERTKELIHPWLNERMDG